MRCLLLAALSLPLTAGAPGAMAQTVAGGALVSPTITCAVGRVDTPHFTHTFDPTEVQRATQAPPFKDWPKNGMTKRLQTIHHYPSGAGEVCASIPELVLETAYYLEYAWAAYEQRLTAQSLPMPTPASGGTIPVRYEFKTSPAAMQFQHQADAWMPWNQRYEQVTVFLQPAKVTMELHRQRSAHELYHFIQSHTVGAAKCVDKDDHGFWWIEAAAEYAACDIVWPDLTGYKGGSERRMVEVINRDDDGKEIGSHMEPAGVRLTYPYLLESPLHAIGLPKNEHGLAAFDGTWRKGQELEYDKGFFVQYLVKRCKVDFLKLDNLVLRYYKDNAGRDVILRALRQSLSALTASVPLDQVYREFATLALLSEDGPIAGTTITKGNTEVDVTPLDCVVKPCQKCPERSALQLPAGPLRVPPRHGFWLPGGFSAKMGAVELHPSATGPGRPLVLRALRLDSSRVQVFTGKKKAWLKGQPKPAAEIASTTDRAKVTLHPDESLYVIAFGEHDTEDGAAVVAICDPPLLTARLTTTGSGAVPASLSRTFSAVLTDLASATVPDTVLFRWSWRNTTDGSRGSVEGERKRLDPQAGTAQTTQAIRFPAAGEYLVRVRALDADDRVIAESEEATCSVQEEEKVTPLPQQTIALPVVTCSSTGQTCAPDHSVTLQGSGEVWISYTASALHCSDVAVRIRLGNGPGQVTGFVSGGQTTDALRFSLTGTDAHRLTVTGVGRVGGCNTGTISGWTGSLNVRWASSNQ